jgi:hypothetical protein
VSQKPGVSLLHGCWIALGLLGTPAWLLTADPVTTYNAVLLASYLELQGSGALPARDLRAFLMWSELVRGAARFPGWALLLRAAAGLTAGRLPGGGDPRWALLAAALLTFSLAAFPRFYLAIASLVPGAEVIRAVTLVYAGTHLTLRILARLVAARSS